MKFCRILFSEISTFLYEMQAHIAFWCWTAWVNSILFFFLQITHLTPWNYCFNTSKHIPEFSDIKKQCQVCYLKEKNNIEFTHAVQHHNAMWTYISQRNVIVTENGILQNFIENIRYFCFQVYILTLVAFFLNIMC